MKDSPFAPKGAPPTRSSQEAGFTLIEAMMATLILTFGLASIFNLMIVATSSNSVANRSTGSTLLANRQLEILRSVPFATLVDSPVGVDTLNIVGPFPGANPAFVVAPQPDVAGVGRFNISWRIQAINANLKFIQVRAEPDGLRGRLSRAEVTTIRACTTGLASGCAAAP